MATCTHALFETSSGYAVFEVKLHDVVGSQEKAVQASIEDYSKFAKMVSLVSFAPFQSAAHALENMNDISESTSSIRPMYQCEYIVLMRPQIPSILTFVPCWSSISPSRRRAPKLF